MKQTDFEHRKDFILDVLMFAYSRWRINALTFFDQGIDNKYLSTFFDLASD